MAEISFIARMATSILKSTKPDYMDSSEKVLEFLKEKTDDANPVKSVFKSFDFNGMQVFHYGGENSKNTILFMHGGAYVNDINYQHHLYCYKLARNLNAKVLCPVYPLAPSHHAMETYDLITELYKSLIEKDNNLTLMGDSAGGGFVLGFCQYLNTIDLPQPDHIVTFSPWVDISMDNPPYDNDDDPILGEVGLKEIGKRWAGHLDAKDFKVSPLYGDNRGLADTLVFAGTNEIFYKDIKRYVERLEEDNVNVKFITGKGLFHIYPLFPIPEAKNAFKIIKKEILG